MSGIAAIYVKGVTDQVRRRLRGIWRVSGDPRRTSLPCHASYSADKDELAYHVINGGEDKSKANGRAIRTIVTSQVGLLTMKTGPCSFLLLGDVDVLVPSRIAGGTCSR